MSHNKKAAAKGKAASSTFMLTTDISADQATQIIEKEHELYKNLNSSTIHELIALYSEAIEHYAGKNDMKYLDFQSRMHKMLVNPDVLRVLQSEAPKPSGEARAARHTKPSSRADQAPRKISSDLNADMQKPPGRVDQAPRKISSDLTVDIPKPSARVDQAPMPRKSSSELVSDIPTFKPPSVRVADAHTELKGSISPINAAKKTLSGYQRSQPHFLSASPNKLRTHKNLTIILDRHSSNTKDTAVRAVNDVKSQDSALERRLASRKKIQLTRSMSFTNYSAFDMSGTTDKSSDEDQGCKDIGIFVIEEHPVEMDKYEKMLEEIMDKSFGERALKVAEIRQKYESQIEEMSGMGDIMEMLVAQMKKNMQDEIAQVVEECDRKRREEISNLKALRSV